MSPLTLHCRWPYVIQGFNACLNSCAIRACILPQLQVRARVTNYRFLSTHGWRCIKLSSMFLEKATNTAGAPAGHFPWEPGGLRFRCLCRPSVRPSAPAVGRAAVAGWAVLGTAGRRPCAPARLRADRRWKPYRSACSALSPSRERISTRIDLRRAGRMTKGHFLGWPRRGRCVAPAACRA